VDRREERLAQNETLFREVNERVEEVSAGLPGGEDEQRVIGFVCECSREDCAEQLELTHAQYEAVRRSPLRFLIVPGHEQTDLERVVERHADFLVVVKLGGAARIAAEHDPRS
jgi:hypothetical protein